MKYAGYQAGFHTEVPCSCHEGGASTLFSRPRCAILVPESASLATGDDPKMASGPSPRSAMEIELTKLSSPRIFLVRMVVFLVLCALVMVVLYNQLLTAVFAN